MASFFPLFFLFDGFFFSVFTTRVAFDTVGLLAFTDALFFVSKNYTVPPYHTRTHSLYGKQRRKKGGKIFFSFHFVLPAFLFFSFLY